MLDRGMQLALFWRGTPGGEFLLDMPEVLIGRGGDAQIDLTDNILVSRAHVMIHAGADGHWLVDLQTRNGTRLNGALVTKVLLKADDRIELGQHELVYGPARPNAMSLAQRFAGTHAQATAVQDAGEMEDWAALAKRVRQTRVEFTESDGTMTYVVLPPDAQSTVGSTVGCDIRVPKTGLFAAKLALIYRDAQGEWTIEPHGRRSRALTVDGEPLAGPLALDDGDVIASGAVHIQFFVGTSG